jgi:hypothetical protein
MIFKNENSKNLFDTIMNTKLTEFDTKSFPSFSQNEVKNMIFRMQREGLAFKIGKEPLPRGKGAVKSIYSLDKNRVFKLQIKIEIPKDMIGLRSAFPELFKAPGKGQIYSIY